MARPTFCAHGSNEPAESSPSTSLTWRDVSTTRRGGDRTSQVGLGGFVSPRRRSLESAGRVGGTGYPTAYAAQSPSGEADPTRQTHGIPFWHGTQSHLASVDPSGGSGNSTSSPRFEECTKRKAPGPVGFLP